MVESGIRVAAAPKSSSGRAVARPVRISRIVVRGPAEPKDPSPLKASATKKINAGTTTSVISTVKLSNGPSAIICFLSNAYMAKLKARTRARS